MTNTAEKSEDLKPVIEPENVSRLGQKWVGRNMTIILSVYLVVVALILILGIVQLWPPPTTAPTTGQSDKVNFLFWTFQMSAETHLVLLVIIASAIGTQAHALRSLYWYVGNRELKYSWIMRYLLMPFAGVALGLAFFFVIRGGFFAAGSGIQDLSPFGFVAMSFLVGMFSDQAAERLKNVAEALFSKPAAGSDASPPKKPGQLT